MPFQLLLLQIVLGLYSGSLYIFTPHLEVIGKIFNTKIAVLWTLRIYGHECQKFQK